MANLMILETNKSEAELRIIGSHSSLQSAVPIFVNHFQTLQLRRKAFAHGMPKIICNKKVVDSRIPNLSFIFAAIFFHLPVSR